MKIVSRTFLMVAALVATLAKHPFAAANESDTTALLRGAQLAGKGLMLDDRLLELPTPGNVPAMNGSIAEHNGRYFVAYRVDQAAVPKGTTSSIFVLELDATLAPIGSPQRLETPLDIIGRGAAEDPRLFAHKGHLFVVFNDLIQFSGERRMVLVQLAVAGTRDAPIFRQVRRKWLTIRDMALDHVEKNWTPFVHEDTLHFVYKTNPPIVARLAVDDWEAEGDEVMLERVSGDAEKIASPLGTMRGGTPGYFLPRHNAYISFYHTFVLVGAQRTYAEQKFTPNPSAFAALYMMGAYLFEGEAPHKISAMTYAPMVPPSAYDDEEFFGGTWPYKKGWITYPTGLIVDEKAQRYYVSYSQNDRRIRVLTIDAKVLDKQWLPPAKDGDIIQ